MVMVKKINSAALLRKIKLENNQIIEVIEQQFLPLSTEKLNHKSTENIWSIAQIFDHITLSLELYEHNMKVALGPYKPKSTKLYYYQGLVGYLAIQTIKPTKSGKARIKLNALPNLKPTNKPFETELIVKECIQELKNFSDLLDSIHEVDLGSIKVVAASGFVLRLKLGDALQFIHEHTKRHLNQAIHLLSSTNS